MPLLNAPEPPHPSSNYSDQTGRPSQPFFDFLKKLQGWMIGAATTVATIESDIATIEDDVDARVRQVATQCFVPDIFTSVNKQAMSRARHRMQDTITSLQILIPNWYVDGVITNPGGFTYAELGTGATATVTASIEYPAGTFTQVLFSGIASGSIPSGSSLLSDSVTVSIPEGAFFFVRTYFTNTAGVIFCYNTLDSSHGEGTEFAASGITDKTMGGTVTQTSGTDMLMPTAIVARSTKKAVLFLGDSIINGHFGGETSATSYANEGYIGRSIGASFAYINAGVGGDRVELFLASHTQRLALKDYCDAAICGYGRNSLGVGRSAATVYADLITAWNLYDIPMMQTTLAPDTTSTDGFITLGNQTVQAWEAQRLGLNAAIRLEPVEIRDYIDTALVLESSLDSGKWAIVPGPTTLDGVHPSYVGSLAVRNSGMVEARLLQVMSRD